MRPLQNCSYTPFIGNFHGISTCQHHFIAMPFQCRHRDNTELGQCEGRHAKTVVVEK